MADINPKKLKVTPLVVDTMPGRNLRKSELEKAAYERTVGMRIPHIFYNSRKTKKRELPY